VPRWAHVGGVNGALPQKGDCMEFTTEELSSYYAALPESDGFDSMCKTIMPPAEMLAGKRALDMACRRGKGVFKLSERVGMTGHATGVDWRIALIERARADEPKAAQRNGLVESNMDFVVAYPEDLVGAGVEKSSYDMIYVNSVLYLFLDPLASLAQMRRVMKPGGLLVIDGVLASTKRDDRVVARARRLGNAIQAAPDTETFHRWLTAAGFDPETLEETPFDVVDPSVAVDAAHRAQVARSDEDVEFRMVLFHVRKNG
jgi:arsenite methyltransferase